MHDGTRTHNTRHHKPTLCQLSYIHSCGGWDSNPRLWAMNPARNLSSTPRYLTLDTLLLPNLQFGAFKLKLLFVSIVGVTGFEPATSASQMPRDNQTTLHPNKISIKYKLGDWSYFSQMLMLLYSQDSTSRISGEGFFTLFKGFSPQPTSLFLACLVNR